MGHDRNGKVFDVCMPSILHGVLMGGPRWTSTYQCNGSEKISKLSKKFDNFQYVAKKIEGFLFFCYVDI
jgi:hypothetical protein